MTTGMSKAAKFGLGPAFLGAALAGALGGTVSAWFEHVVVVPATARSADGRFVSMLGYNVDRNAWPMDYPLDLAEMLADNVAVSSGYSIGLRGMSADEQRDLIQEVLFVANYEDATALLRDPHKLDQHEGLRVTVDRVRALREAKDRALQDGKKHSRVRVRPRSLASDSLSGNGEVSPWEVETPTINHQSGRTSPILGALAGGRLSGFIRLGSTSHGDRTPAPPSVRTEE